MLWSVELVKWDIYLCNLYIYIYLYMQTDSVVLSFIIEKLGLEMWAPRSTLTQTDYNKRLGHLQNFSKISFLNSSVCGSPRSYVCGEINPSPAPRRAGLALVWAALLANENFQFLSALDLEEACVGWEQDAITAPLTALDLVQAGPMKKEGELDSAEALKQIYSPR
jgi:hypothetical protein